MLAPSPPAPSTRRRCWVTLAHLFAAVLLLVAWYIVLGLLATQIPGVVEKCWNNFWAAVFFVGGLSTHVMLSIGLVCRYGFEVAEDLNAYTALICVFLWLILFVPISLGVYLHKVYLYVHDKYPLQQEEFLVEYLLPQ